MCKFYSGISKGDGKLYSFDHSQRLNVKTFPHGKYKGRDISHDSHTSIALYYGCGLPETVDSVWSERTNEMARGEEKG